MKNKMLRSFLLLVYFPVLMLTILTPAYAITTTIKPSDAINGTNTDAYTATLDPTGASADIFILNITIPAGYTLTIPAVAGKTVGNYTMLNTTTGTNKVIINITSAAGTDKVNVTFSTNYGATYSNSSNQNISNMSIGASTLNITKPTSSTAGYFNLSLGGTAGPITTNNRVTLTLANGTLTNPSTVSTYTWNLVAKNSPAVTVSTSNNDVRIAAGASNTVTVPVFNASIPVNASLPLPSGNLTVNITTTANVTNLAITLRNFTGDPGTPITGASGLSRIMFFGIDAPALSNVSFTARISINYSSVLPLSIPEANLRIYRFNVSTSAWEATSNNSVDTTAKIVSADVTGFSTFALMGAAAAAAPSGGGGGGGGNGGGSGGGGVTTSEPFENIAKAERYDRDLIANAPITYTFTAPEHGITEIVITGKESENAITLRVEVLKGTSKLVTASPPGTVYKNVNAWLGTKRVKEALIRFKVENLWISSNNFATSDVNLVKWDGSKWVQIETTEKSKDSTYTYYEAKSDTFSEFAITGLKAIVEVPTPIVTATTSEVTPAKTVVPGATKPTPGFEAILTIFAIALSVASLIKGRKRR